MIRETIQKEVIAAMKGGNKERTAALRLIQAKIKDRDIEIRGKIAQSEGRIPEGYDENMEPIRGKSFTPPADNEIVTDVILKMAKQRKESIQMYRDGGREDLAAQEEAELAVIEEFLPKQMDEAETKAAIEAVKADTGASSIKDMGKVMAELKTRHGATLDMSRTSGWVKESFQ